MDVPAALAVMEATLADADAELVTSLGGHREVTRARLWQGQVLVEWEADEDAGGCLLRPKLVQRLIALHAEVTPHGNDELRLRASGRIVEALSAAHRQLVQQLGGAGSVELRARLRFAKGVYRGGEETYAVVAKGRRADVLRLNAQVSPRAPQAVRPHTSPAPT